MCVCALKKTCEPRTTFACVQARRQLCKRVGNSSALLWLVDVAARAHEKIKGNTARRRLRRQGAPLSDDEAQSRRRSRSRFARTQPPIAAILKRAQSSAATATASAAATATAQSRNNVAASVRAVRSFAIGRCTRSVQSKISLTQPVAQYDSITAAKANLRVQRQ